MSVTNLEDLGAGDSDSNIDVDSTETEGSISTGNAFFTQAESLAFTAPVTGTYRIAWFFEAKNSDVNGVSRTRVQLDGADQSFADIPIPVDVTADIPVSGFRQLNLTAGAHTLDIDHFPLIGTTSTLRRRRLSVRQVS